MKISKNGLDLIKKYEGLELEPYLCPAKVPTIGYGATYYPDGGKVSMNDLKITELYAEELLLSMLNRYEKGVERYVQVEINQCQFDALVSFAYNLGLGALKSSTLLKRVNSNPCDENISYQFKRWTKAGGKELAGLVKRRNEESNLYFK
jgi:lysozyme